MRKTYIPNPIDTSDVELSEEINDLVERIAANTHDVWAAQRLAQGWSYGPERNDTLKETPCLVPYEYLHEDEKIYDCQVSSEVVKVIIKLGYKITKNR